MSSAATGFSGIPSSRIGLGTDIVEILKAYNTKLPIDFLASVLKRTKTEIHAELSALQEHKAVRLEGEYVELRKSGEGK